MRQSLADSPKVSVVVPIYNGGDHLATSLESALGQTLSNIEIICVDDGSTDNSAHLIKSFAQNDPRVRYLHQSNQGSGAARNNGLSHALGEYISFLDADDRYPSHDVLSTLVSAADQSGAKIAGGGVALRNGDTVTPGKDRGDEWHFSSEGLKRYIDYQFDYGYQRFLFSRDLLVENDISFPDYLRYQDPPFLVKALSAAQNFYGVTIDTYDYRVSHKEVSWNDRKVCDLVKGIRDCFNIAVRFDLEKLQSRTFHRINREYRKEIEASLKSGNSELLEMLVFLNCDMFQHAKNPQKGQGRQLLMPLSSLVEGEQPLIEKKRFGLFSRLFR